MVVRALRVLMLGAVLALPVVQNEPAMAVAPTPAAWDLVGAINQERYSLGLAPVAYLAAIDDMAARQARAIADAGRLFHNASLGRDAGARVSGWMRVGENVAYASSVSAIHSSLMASPPHRANILGDYNYIAVAVVERDGKLWAAQVFLRAPDGLETVTRVPVKRVHPASNAEAAVAASRATFASGSASRVVIARQDVFADALAGGPLAGAGRGPVLLTPRDEVAPATIDETRRVLQPGGTVYLMGGPAALSDEVESAFRRAGLATERVAGADRFETAVQAAQLVNPAPKMILLVSGSTFADAMSATPAAVKARAPLVLADRDDLPKATLLYLTRHPSATRVVIGGTASVGDRAALLALATERIAGIDRFETSVLVARRWFETSTALLVTTGATFQDAAIAGPLSSRLDAPLILTTTPPSSSTYSFVRDRLVQLRRADIVGSTDEVPPSAIALLLS